MKPLTFGQRLGMAVRDGYFLIGSILITFLVLVAVLGPQVAPHNPFLVKPIQWIDGELQKAPFAPGDLYPLGTDDQGRDQLSLLLYGASTTLVMALIATVVRLLLGLIMGTIAGWWPGNLFDRAVTAFTEFLASVPGLILAILLVFAVGLHRGQIPFVVALSIVGCGEVAQIMRGHVLTIRNELYIEAARAVGLSGLEILSRHVLPNLIGTLLALTALEMGSVLLLLGELGFLNIFIGGGRVVASETTLTAAHFFDVPDWGAMLGTSWRWFRSYPWYPLAPAAAFFVSILGFNLFGYGLQRFMERGRFHPSGASVLRFLVVVTLILVGARALLLGTGVEAQFAKHAREFDTERAMMDVSNLVEASSSAHTTSPDGPSPAAEYIAAQFEEMGLSYTTKDGSYFNTYTAARGWITLEPVLEVLDDSGNTRLQIVDGISFDPWQAFASEGTKQAELIIVANNPSVGEQGVVLTLDPDEPLRVPWVGTLPFEGILRMVPDDGLGRRDRAPAFDVTSYGSLERLPSFPNLLITESAVRQILELAEIDLGDVRTRRDTGQEMVFQTGLQVRLTCGLVYKESVGTNVVGYIAGADVGSRGERILIAANYGASYGGNDSGADENASSIAAMLEMARTLQAQEFMPKRTIVFAAFDDGGDFQFVNSPPLPTGRSERWTTVILHGIGAGSKKLARVEQGAGLASSFDQSAHRLGVGTKDLADWRFFFIANGSRLSWGDPRVHTSYQGVAVTRLGDDLSGTAADMPDHLDPEKLAKAAQAVLHFVMVVSYR